MERAISEMEKIRKAEEIYSRRNNLASNSNNIISNKSKTLYKNLFQILVLLDIAIVIVAFQNRDNIFKEEFITQINSYNINVKEKLEELFNEKNNSENTESVEKEKSSQQAKENVNNSEIEMEAVLVENEAKQLSQMEQDILDIKSKYSIILPLQGVKTSGFGERTSENKIVTHNHTGVDLSANTGTVIKSAMSGTVTQVSSEGDYGNHLRITVDDLTTLYAHCSKIYVSEGDSIIQGQDIAEVGSTRK